MKNKTLKLVVMGMTIVGALGFAAGTAGSNNNSHVNVQTTPKISMESAKATALREVSGANANEVTKMELDREHGMLVYEIKIVHNNTKYGFNIDATTGQVIGRETKVLRDYQNTVR